MDDPSGGLLSPRTPPLAKDFFNFWPEKFQPLGSISAQEIERLANVGRFLMKPATCMFQPWLTPLLVSGAGLAKAGAKKLTF